MPLQNRVAPWGKLHAVDAKGTLMGNRGILHNEFKRIITPWKGKGWVTCVLSFQGRKREVFSPGSYSELFFLDEATAFSAGHRPCAECQRSRYKEFKTAWEYANKYLLESSSVRSSDIDGILHSERALRGGGKVKYETAVGTLPNGTMVELDGKALLIWYGKMLPWSFSGYGNAVAEIHRDTRVCVLTPRSVVAAFSAGFEPHVHESAVG